jgi:VWFA-related protein
MEKLIFAVFLILVNLNSLFGQSNRVRPYSESSAETNHQEKTKKPFRNQTIETGKEAAAQANANSDVIKIETELVIVPTRIADRKGRAVAGLKREEFKIFEDGVEQELAYFSNEEQPFTVALVLDMSYSSVFKLKDIQGAAFEFVGQLRPADKLMIVSFDEKVNVLCEPTNNRKVLRLAIEATKIASGTSFYSALDVIFNQKFNSVPGRKAVVVLSDGVDTTSRKNIADKILNTVGETDVLVFPIQYDTYDDVQKSRRRNAQIFYDENDRPYTIEMPRVRGEREEDYRNANDFLKEISLQSGGRVYRVSSSSNLNEAFADIADELRKIYSLGYYPSVKAKAGDRHTVKVRVYRPDLVVRAKSSYLRKRN